MFPAILRASGPPKASSPRRILQNIQVLSAGTDIQRDAEGKPQQVQVVNLLVTPDQAEILSLASDSMKIQLVLRNPLDTQTAKVPATAMRNLFDAGLTTPATSASRQGARKAKPKPYSMMVMNGATPRKRSSDHPRDSIESEGGAHLRMLLRAVVRTGAVRTMRAQSPPASQPPAAETSYQDSTNELSVGVGKTILVDYARPIQRVARGYGRPCGSHGDQPD